MANVVSGVATAINCLCDICNLGQSIDSLIRAKDADEDGWIESASVANSLAMVGFSIAEIGMLLSGTKSETLSKLKNIEIVPRIINLPVQFLLESKIMATQGVDDPVELRILIRLIERGIIAPTSDLVRTAASAEVYYEQHFLDMSPEQLKEAKRPIYEEVFDGENSTRKIVGYKPVDPNECKTNIEKLRRDYNIATTVRMLAQKGAVETTCDLTIRTYAVLAEFFGLRHRPAVPAPGEAAPPAEEEMELHINFLDFDRIPEPLYGDQVFKNTICPITQRPIRDPVRDPTNGITLYERSAIINWLRVNPRSPITHMEFHENQLQEAPVIRDLINQRLQEYQDGLQQFIDQHADEP